MLSSAILVGWAVSGCRSGANGESEPGAAATEDSQPAPAPTQPVNQVTPPEGARPRESSPATPQEPAPPAAPTPHWQPDLSVALQVAEREDKPVMALFYHRTYGGSMELRREGMNDPEVGRLAQFFSCVQIEYDNAVEKAEELGVAAVPCLVFLRPDGTPFMTAQGYGTPHRVANSMEEALRRYRSGGEARPGPMENR